LSRRYDLFIPSQFRPCTSDHGYRSQETISLPAELARDAEALAKAEGKTLSAVIQDALRQTRIERRLQELRGMQATGAARRVIVEFSPSGISSAICAGEGD